MKRRTFLKTSLTTAGALLVQFRIQSSVAQEHDGTKLENSFNPTGYIEISNDNIITLHFTKLEMGQGVATSYLAIIAEELNTPPSNINLTYLPYTQETESLYGSSVTGGSTSIRKGWNSHREAAAATRDIFAKAGAKFWNIPIDKCLVANAQVENTLSKEVVNFSQLTPIAANIAPPKELKFVEKRDFKFIGKRQQQFQNLAVTKGDKTFSIDKKIAGLKFANIIHCPTITGKVKRFNKAEVGALPGVVDCVVIPRELLTSAAKPGDALEGASLREGIAVIADSYWQAVSASKKLKIQWEHTLEKYNNDSLRQYNHELLNKRPEPYLQHTANITKTGKLSTYTSRFECPYVAHHYMEPLNAIANVTKESCEVWAGTQGPRRDTYAISTALNIAPEKIKINVLAAGGSFGRKFNPDFTLEAAYLSQQIAAPVKILWTREEEVSKGQQSDYELQEFSVEIDEQGQITNYLWQSVISGKWVSELNVYLLHIPNFEFSFQRREKTLNLAPWRAVQRARTNFGVECFVDELAEKLEKDVLVYRLSLLDNPVNLPDLDDRYKGLIDAGRSYRAKYINLLTKLTEIIDWKEATQINNADNGRGIGIATGYYGGTSIVQVVDLTVNKEQVKINKVISLVDCGIVIDVAGAEQQIEGSIIWMLGAMFMPPTIFENSQIQQTNFDDASLLRAKQAPLMETHFIDNENMPTGLGEPAVCSFAPALANAMYRATGKRVYERNLAHMYKLV